MHRLIEKEDNKTMSSSAGNGESNAVARRVAQFNHYLTLAIFLWPSLALAVSNSWGGPDSASKREWFAATLIDVLAEEQDADPAWIEQFLLQVMEDEFDVVVDDGSACEVAEKIVLVRAECARGEFASVSEAAKRWEERRGADMAKEFAPGVHQENKDDDDDDDAESLDDETSSEEDEEGDVTMDEAPQLVKVREPVVPEVDEEGFTKVTKKRR